MNFLKKQSPVRIISLGFALVILIGSVLLSLPCSIRDGVTLRYIDALYMSTSAVCVIRTSHGRRRGYVYAAWTVFSG